MKIILMFHTHSLLAPISIRTEGSGGLNTGMNAGAKFSNTEQGFLMQIQDIPHFITIAATGFVEVFFPKHHGVFGGGQAVGMRC